MPISSPYPFTPYKGPVPLGAAGTVLTSNGTNALPTFQAAGGSIAYSIISPAALAAGNTNDYAPTGIATATMLQITGDAGGSTLTGILARAAIGVLTLNNIGAADIVIASSNVASAAANRIVLVADLTLPTGASITLYYDLSNARWRSS